MVTDGFVATDPVYLAVQAAISQTPSPKQIKVGRGGNDFTHAVELSPQSFAATETITVSITKGTTTRDYSQAGGGVSLAAEATALAAAINADASGWGTSGSAELTVAAVGDIVEIDAVSPANDNEMWYYDGLTNCFFEDKGVDRGISADLTAIEAYDSDWYALIPADAFGSVEILLMAAWCETRQKIMSWQTQDSTCASAGTGISHDIAALNRDRSLGVFTKHALNQYLNAGYAGRFLPRPAGEVSWADKTISGAVVSALTATEITNLTADNCNYYSLTGSEDNIFAGWVASGEFVDIIRLTDWTVQRVMERLLAVARSVDKIPFDDAGVAQIKGSILNVMKEKVPKGFVKGSLSFTAPLVADVDAADKALRILPNVTFGATFAGAILYVEMECNLSF
jgi:hypothetical protein